MKINKTVLFLAFLISFAPLFGQSYFCYEREEVEKLQDLSSDSIMSEHEILKWDKIAYDLANEDKSINRERVFAYLCTAQRDAACLSFSVKGCFQGSLEPVSKAALSLFFPTTQEISSDSYSQKISEYVMKRLRDRFDEENLNLRQTPISENDPRLKPFPQPPSGLTAASFMSWLLPNPLQYEVSPPPSVNNAAYWMQQTENVKDQLSSLTKQQKKACQWWAGDKGPSSGDWLAIATNYMIQSNTDFSKMLIVRSVLAQSMVDGEIALFNAKYSCLIPRPQMVDRSIKPFIVCPKHPSYPSGHSTLSMLAATILSFYFPENKEQWFVEANEAGLSRIWGGIHFPIDNSAGQVLGKEIGEDIVKCLN